MALLDLKPVLRLCCAVSLAWSFAADCCVAQRAIGVNFIGGIDSNGASVTGSAGLFAQSSWNNLEPWTVAAGGQVDGTFSGLLDSSGLVTSAGITWGANNTWAADNPGLSSEDARLMDGYIDNSASRDVLVQLTGIPFASYDLIVYVGSDGNGRTGAVKLTADSVLNPPLPDTWYITNTGVGSFSGPGDYRQATALAESSAVPSNFVRHAGLRGSDLRIEIIRGSNNSGIHGLQIVQAITPSRIEVNTISGQVTLVGGDAIPVGLNSYEIRSSAGSLLPAGLRGLSAQGLDSVDANVDTDSIPGNSPGEAWTVVNAEPAQVFESFLFGGTTVDATRRVALGRIYNTSFGQDSTLQFEYGLTSGLSAVGQVVFVNTPPLTGDYNFDMVVDAADYTVWRDTLGATGPGLAADGDGSGVIDAADYAVWRGAFGAGGAAASSAVVPEPTAAALVLVTVVTVAFRNRSFLSLS